jgi:hypothetical protein
MIYIFLSQYLSQYLYISFSRAQETKVDIKRIATMKPKFLCLPSYPNEGNYHE